MTVTFYTALHIVDALLAFDRVEGINRHDARNSVLLKTNKYLAIRRAYMPLYSLSRTVRYLADPAKWISTNMIEPKVFSYLYSVENSAQNLMKKDLHFEKITLSSKGNSDSIRKTATPPPS